MMKFILNGIEVPNTLNLLDATNDSQSISPIDVKSTMPDNDDNLTIELQLYFGDEFTLDSDIQFFIDNVTITVGYHVIVDYPEYDTEVKDYGYETSVEWSKPFSINFTYNNKTNDANLTGAGIAVEWLDGTSHTIVENSGVYQFTG